jgi:hypothetical protein
MFKSVLDPDFKYRSADDTDVRLTFARIRRQQQSAQQRRSEREPPGAKVAPIVSSPDSGQDGRNHWPFP